MIIATDFDGTIVTHEFPRIGEELPYAIATLKKLRERGHQLFLWTMRGHPDLSRFPHVDKDTQEYIPTDTLQDAIDWCAERGLEFDGINESPAQFSTSCKQYARIYIDDAALGCPKTPLGSVDWYRIVLILTQKKILTIDDAKDILENNEESSTYNRN